MFRYQSMFRQNASGKALKVIGFSIISGIFMMVPMMVLMGIFSLPLFSFNDSPWMILYFLLGVFLFFILSIFVFYPMTIGIIRYFTNAYNDTDFGLGELFFVFKGGRYGKAVKATVLVVIFYFLFSLIIGIVANILYLFVNAPFSALAFFSPTADSIEQGVAVASGQIGMFILMLVLNLILTLLLYIPYILAALYIGLVYLSFVDQPLIPTMDKFKIAWDVMFKSGESIWRLFFSNVFLAIGVSILYFVIVIVGVILGVVMDSPGALITIFILGTIVFLLSYIYIAYIMIGSVVAYYYTARGVLDERAAVEAESNETPSVEQ
jgi:hypothetical protein